MFEERPRESDRYILIFGMSFRGGGFRGRLAILTIAIAALDACGHSPMAPSPTQVSLAGRWVGGLSASVGGPTGLGDWSRLVLTLQPSGGDELVTNDGQHLSIDDTVRSGQRILDVALQPHDSCDSVGLVIQSVEVDDAGSVDGFSGSLSGRWCNTLVDTFTFKKG